MTVHVGIPLFMLRPEHMAPVAQRAEALGFESVWVAEHLVFPTEIKSRYPYSAEGMPPINPATPLLDPLLVLTQIAALTARIRLGTNIYILPLRHPIAVARMAMTLDVLSRRPLQLRRRPRLAGGGVRRRRHRLRDAAPAARASAVRALRALWTESEPEFHGRYVRSDRSSSSPSRCRSRTRRSSSAARARRRCKRAARLGDGWYGVGHTPESAGGAGARACARCSPRRAARSAPFEMHGQPRPRRARSRRRGALRRRRRRPRRLAALAPRPRGRGRPAAPGGARAVGLGRVCGLSALAPRSVTMI